jgi:hypothetical protein
MMLSLLLIGSCTATPVTIASCPPFPWPTQEFNDFVKVGGEKSVGIQTYYIALIKHGTECDELNKE